MVTAGTLPAVTAEGNPTPHLNMVPPGHRVCCALTNPGGAVLPVLEHLCPNTFPSAEQGLKQPSWLGVRQPRAAREVFDTRPWLTLKPEPPLQASHG